ncbi:MAG: TIGR03435 family protein [Bacteroidota bacterium]
MKKTMLVIACLLSGMYASAQVSIGQKIPAIKLQTILNAPAKTVELESLKGKVIWLEFWATYCGPCITAMTHVEQLQKQYKGKLQVITITVEKEKRINQFLKTLPFALWFAVDTADAMRNYFPYSTIPHSVLIDATGKVVAITAPENITSKTIAAVIAGKPVDLPLKQDDMTEDPIKAYFSAADTVTSRVLIQPEIKGARSMGKTYPMDTAFKNRRLTMMNLPLESIYRMAYQDLPYGRTIDLTPKEDIKQNKTKYCVDIIVPKGQEAELYQTLVKDLQQRFDLKVAIEKRKKDVYVLKIANAAKIKLLTPSAKIGDNISGSSGAFSGEGVKLEKIADYLEGFGLVNMPVVDETGDSARYDITFNYQPEKKGALTEALTSLGLKLEKGQREIDMLVFR